MKMTDNKKKGTDNKRKKAGTRIRVIVLYAFVQMGTNTVEI